MSLAKKSTNPSFFLTDEQSGERFDLAHDFVIGRVQGEKTFPQDMRMSARHARILIDGSDVFIEDLKSRNGIFINGTRIERERPTRILPGDMIELGDHVFCLGRSLDTPQGSIPSFSELTRTEVLARPSTVAAQPQPTAPSSDPLPPQPTEATESTATAGKILTLPATAPLPETDLKLGKKKKKVTLAEIEKTISDEQEPNADESATSNWTSSNEIVSTILVSAQLLAFIVLYVITVARGPDLLHPAEADLIRWGANQIPLTLGGQWWRLVSSLFVHASLVQLAANAALIWQLAPHLARACGTAAPTLIFLGGGAIIAAVSLVLSPESVHTGSTGAALALLGAALPIVLRERKSIEAGGLAHILFASFVFGASNAGAWLDSDASAPLVALALGSGAIMGALLRAPSDSELRSRVARFILALGLTIGAVTCAISLAYVEPPSDEGLRELLEKTVPLAQRHEELASKWNSEEIDGEEFSSELRGTLLPRLRELKEQSRKLPTFFDRRKDAVENLTLAFERIEEAWTIRMEAAPDHDEVALRKADEAEKAGHQHMETVTAILKEWNSAKKP